MIYSSLSALVLLLALKLLVISSAPPGLSGRESADEAPREDSGVPPPLVLLVEAPPEDSPA